MREFGRKSIGAAAVVVALAVGHLNGQAGTMDLHLYGGFDVAEPIPGSSIEDLTGHASFPDDPVFSSHRGELPLLESPSFPDPFEEGDTGANEYGLMIEGYLEVPEGGSWKLFIRSSDASRLEFNPEGPDPDGAEVVAEEPQAGNPFLDDGLRSSEGMELERGEQYYFRILMKAGTGEDWVQIGWSGPGFADPEPIDGKFVQRFVGDSPGPDVLQPGAPQVTRPPESQTVEELAPVELEVAVDALPPVDYQWLKDGEPIEGAVNSFLKLDHASLEDDGAGFELEVSNAEGTTVSQVATLNVEADTQPPEVVEARGSGDPHGVIVRFSDPLDEASATDPSHYAVSGQDVTIEGARLINPSTVLLEVTELTADPMSLSVSEVRDRSAAGNQVAAGTEVSVTLAPDRGLVAYWPFDEGEGESVADAVGEFTGTFDGDGEPEWVSEAPDFGERENPASLRFEGVDGEDSHVRTEFPGIGGGNPRTVSAWIRTWQLPERSEGFIFWGSLEQNGQKYAFRINTGTDTLRTEVSGGNVWGSTELVEDEWFHVVSVVPDVENADNLDVLHYVNGEFDPPDGGASQVIDTEIESAEASPVVIGEQAPVQRGGRGFTGFVDDVAIFDTALSPAAVAALAAGADPREVARPTSGALTIAEQPESETVDELQSVTFEVQATSEGSDAVINYRWFRDGERIRGATEPTFTIDSASVGDDGAVFTVEVFNSHGTFERLTSEEAVLTVEEDLSAAEVVEIEALAGSINTLVIRFDEEVEEESATDPTNYAIEGLTVNEATLSLDGRTVTLSTSQQVADQEYTLEIDGVSDLAAAGNTSMADVSFTSTISYSQEVLFDEPVRYWRLSESSGSTAFSEVTGEEPLDNAHATYLDDPILGVDGLIPNEPDNLAVNFAGDGNAEYPHSPDINQASPFYVEKTLEVWIRPDEILGPDEGQAIFDQGCGARGIGLYLVGNEVFMNVYNNVDDGGSTPFGSWTTGRQGLDSDPDEDHVFVGGGNIAAGEVAHIVGVYNGHPEDASQGTLELYVNGELVDETTGAGRLHSHTNGEIGGIVTRRATPRHLGEGQELPMTRFHGTIDDFSYYNKALPAERVQGHFEAAFAGTELVGAPEILADPEDTTVAEHGEAEFTVEFGMGVPPFDVAWFKDGELIRETRTAGTRDSVAFTAGAEDDGAAITAEVGNAEGTATSAEAILTVEADVTPPEVLDVRGFAGGVDTIVVRFSEEVDPASATDLSHYEIEGLSLNDATLSDDGRTVTLHTGAQTLGEELTLVVDGVTDVAAAANAVTAETAFTSVTSYAQEVLADGPVRYWRLSETAGEQAFSEVADDDNLGAAHGTYNGGPTLGAEGLIPNLPGDTAVNFAPGQWMDIPDGGDVNVGGPYLEKTIEMWIRPDEILAVDAAQGLWEQGGGARGISFYMIGNEVFMNVWNNPDDGVGTPWGSGTTESQDLDQDPAEDHVFVGGGDIDAGQRVHVVGVFEGVADDALDGTLRLYLNGELVDETEGAGQLFNHGGDVDLATAGRRHTDTGTFNFNGTIDDVSVYNTALSDDRVKAHFEAAYGGVVPLGGPEITAEPEATSVQELANAELTVEFGGTPPYEVAWFKNGEEIRRIRTAESRDTVRFPASLDDDAINISVEVSNEEGSTTSADAQLSVTPDEEPPGVVSVQGLAAPDNEVRIRFDEAVTEGSATDLAHYTISGLTIDEARLGDDARGVVLATEEQNPGVEFQLEIDGVRDRSAAGNALTTEVSFTASSLLAYWPFDEGQAGAAADVTGGYSGTLQGNPDWTSEVPDLGGRENPSALAFDGQGDFVRTDFPGIGGPSPRTLSLWIQPQNLNEGSGFIHWGGNFNVGEAGAKYAFRIDSDTNTLRTEVQGGNNWASTELVEGQWYHVVSVVPDIEEPDNDDVLHYLNGELDPRAGGASQGIDTDTSSDAAVPVSIGAQSPLWRGMYFTGLIDDVAFFNTALSGEQIAQLAEGGDPREVAGAAPVEEGPRLEVALSAGQVSLTWEVDAVLETATSVTGPWEASDQGSPATFSVDEEEGLFFRLVQ